MTTTFLAEQFTPSKYQTAQEKAEFANRFVSFVTSGYNPNIFTKKFYQRLSMCFGHIAHYNQDGFYGTFFATLEGQLRFADITENTQIYGDPHFTDSDVEIALQKWAHGYSMVEKAQRNLNAGIESAERAEYLRLQEKYNPEVFRKNN